MVCTSVVSGLDNFVVGMLDTFPPAGSAVNTSSYTVCEIVRVNATVGLVVNISCPPSTQQFRYVIVQSLDTSPESLCIAEVAVYCTSQCAIIMYKLMQHCLSASYCHSTDKHVFLFGGKGVVLDKLAFNCCHIDKLMTTTYHTSLASLGNYTNLGLHDTNACKKDVTKVISVINIR